MPYSLTHEKATAIRILSFDIEEWFMLEDTRLIPQDEWKLFMPRLDYNTRKVLDVLHRQDTKGVFYFLGWVAEHYPDLVKDVFAAGHEIGYHTYHHHNIDAFSPDAFELDLKNGLDLLENITGYRPISFRAPNFSMHEGNLWAIPILIRNGITINSSMRHLSTAGKSNFPQKPFKWQCNGQELWEFPLVPGRVGNLPLHFAGSGYFRLLPDVLIHYFTNAAPYCMFYFHPRDFDPVPQRSPKLSLIRNIKNSLNTKSALQRLENLTINFSFLSLHEAIFALDSTQQYSTHLL